MPPPTALNAGSASSPGTSRRSSFPWDTSMSSQSDQDEDNSLREALRDFEFDLGSILDNVLDCSSTPLLNFESQKSESVLESTWDEKQSMPAALRRHYSYSDMYQLRLARESGATSVILSGMHVVRNYTRFSQRRDRDAQTV